MWMLGNSCTQWCEVWVNLYVTTKQYRWSMRYVIRCGQHVKIWWSYQQEQNVVFLWTKLYVMMMTACMCVHFTGHDYQASGVTAAYCTQHGESAQLIPGNQRTCKLSFNFFTRFFASELFRHLWSFLWKDRDVYVAVVIFLFIIIYDFYLCVNGIFSYQLLWVLITRTSATDCLKTCFRNYYVSSGTFNFTTWNDIQEFNMRSKAEDLPA